jgi:hypothetical protein
VRLGEGGKRDQERGKGSKEEGGRGKGRESGGTWLYGIRSRSGFP